jgi:hypothetical protein
LLSLPLKKLVFGAGQYFGPSSGLGPITYGNTGGEMRAVLQGRIALPIRLDGPFLWELSVMGAENLPEVHFALDRPGTQPVLAPVWAGRACSVIGMAGPAAAGTGWFALTVTPAEQACQIQFLGLSLLPLADPSPVTSVTL